MTYEINLATAQAIRTAVIRSRVSAGELARFVPAACGEVASFLRSSGGPRWGRHVALYLDSGWVEVGAEVSEPFEGNERVRLSELPAGRVATLSHFGPYRGLGEAHREIRQWCAAREYRLAGRFWEIYGHWEESWNADPARIRTDVFHLLQDR